MCRKLINVLVLYQLKSQVQTLKLTLSPSYISVLVQGTPTDLNFIKRENFIAYVDARGLKPGRYELDVKVKIPSGTVLIETFPVKINVTVKD